MNVWQLTGDLLELRVVCADITGILNQLSQDGILINQIKKEDDLTVSMQILSKDYQSVLEITKKFGAYVKGVVVSIDKETFDKINLL